VSFTDNGDGTATLSGTPAAGSAGTYQFTISADNGVTPNATQGFTLIVGQLPAVSPSQPPPVSSGPPSTPSPGQPSTPTPAAFGARTLVSLNLSARRIPVRGPPKVLVNNANGFRVTGILSGRTVDRASLLRGVKLRAESFRVDAHAKKTLRLRLPTALQRVLRRDHKLRLRLTAKVKDPAGHTRTVNTRVTPRLRPT
jgi:hypothetical protein